MDIGACGTQSVQERFDDIVVPPGQGVPFKAHLQNSDNDIWADYNLFLFNDCETCFSTVPCPQ